MNEFATSISTSILNNKNNLENFNFVEFAVEVEVANSFIILSHY